MPDPTRPHHLATVEPAMHVDVDVDAGLAAAIDRRRTDRRPFRAWPVPPELTGELAEIADRYGIGLEVVTDPRARRRLFRSIERRRAPRTPTPPTSPSSPRGAAAHPDPRDGVPADRAPTPVTSPGGCRCAPSPVPALQTSTGSAEPESAVLLLLSTATDTPLQWLRVGEVTSAVLLTATHMGLAGSPLTQPLEVSGTRTFVRDHVTGGAHPQMLLRLGWPSGKSLPPTPRRPLKEVVTR